LITEYPTDGSRLIEIILERGNINISLIWFIPAWKLIGVDFQIK
jgi:hypothetical protein